MLLRAFEEALGAVAAVLAIDDAECLMAVLILELVGDFIDALMRALMAMHQLQSLVMLVFL